MSAQDLIDEAKRIRQKLRNPPNAVHDPGINLTRQSTAYKGDIPPPDTPPKKVLRETERVVYPVIQLPLGFEDIVEAVSSHYGVSPAAIRGSSRRSHTCFARFVVVHLSLKLLAKRSLKSIGRSLNKDHSSILHARDRISAIIAGNSQVANEVQMIESYIETAHNHRSSLPNFSQCGVAVEPGTSPQVQAIHGMAG